MEPLQIAEMSNEKDRLRNEEKEEMERILRYLSDLVACEEVVLKKKWQGGKINFGNFDKYKILKEVYLTSLYPCFLKVETETGTQLYNIKKNKQMQRVRINKRGRYFGIEFYSNNPQVYLSNPQFLFSVQE